MLKKFFRTQSPILPFQKGGTENNNRQEQVTNVNGSKSQNRDIRSRQQGKSTQCLKLQMGSRQSSAHILQTEQH